MSLFSASSPLDFFISLCIRLLIIFTILPIHEFAHGYAARKMGDNTALISGRLTLNPLAHLDIFGALMMVLVGFGWAKPVPINPRNFKNYKKGIAITAFAGPLSNLICAAIAIFLMKIVENVSVFATNDSIMYVWLGVMYFAQINLSLAIFNLIPIPPLDGSKILSCIVPYKVIAFMNRYQMYIYLIFIALIFTGVLSGPLSFLINFFFDLFYMAFFWVDKLFGLFL